MKNTQQIVYWHLKTLNYSEEILLFAFVLRNLDVFEVSVFRELRSKIFQ